MIAFIRGEIDRTTDNSVIIDCNGVGYLIQVSPQTISKLFGKSIVKLYTYHQTKEDGMSLYGFLSYEELAMFNRLITVTGLGPKSVSSLLGSLTPGEISLAILTEDAAALSKAPGIGKKTAQRIILDLKDKVKNEEAFASSQLSPQESFTGDSSRSDAIAALTTLGYGRSDAVKAVVSIAAEGMTTEQLLRAALKKLAGV